MSALAISLADAVVAQLNAAALSLPFTATRAWLNIRDLADLADLTVTVIPENLGVRAKDYIPRNEYDWDIAIWIQKRTDGSTGQIDPLMQLHQEIIETFKPWWGKPGSKLIGVASQPAPTLDRQDQLGLFEAKIVLSVRAVI